MGKTPRRARIKLTEEQADSLKDDWKGGGGFQTLGPQLADKLSAENEIELDDEHVGVIVRHMSYKSSGFRSRIRNIFREHIVELMSRK